MEEIKTHGGSVDDCVDHCCHCCCHVSEAIVKVKEILDALKCKCDECVDHCCEVKPVLAVKFQK